MEIGKSKSDSPMNRGSKTTQWKQWAAGITATVTMVCAGSTYGWATISLPRLLANDSAIKITSDESSWIVALVTVGGALGPIMGALCGDSIGRKNTLILTGLIYALGWLITLLATEVNSLYVARVVLGLGGGLTYTICPLYVSEIADVSIRGALGSITTLNFSSGVLLASVVGLFVSSESLTMVLLSLPFLFIVGFLWFPESPCFLFSKGRHEQAARSLAFFKGIADLDAARRELDIVIRGMDEDAKQLSPGSWKEKLSELLLPTNRKALLIVTCLMTAHICGGNIATISYMDVLLRKINITMDPDIATSVTLLISLLFSAAGTFLMERAGRRQLLMLSTLGLTAATATLATYLFLHDVGVHLDSVHSLPVVAIAALTAFHHVGLSSIPYVLVGELFPTRVRGIASAVMSEACAASGFFVTKAYQVVGDGLGEYVMYCFFCLSNLSCFLFVLVVLPETKNRTLVEIQEELGDSRAVCCRKGKKREMGC